MAKTIKALSLPTLQVPGYPKAKAGETAVDPRDIYIWQQDVATVKKQIIQLEENNKTRSTHMCLSSGSARPTSTASPKGPPCS